MVYVVLYRKPALCVLLKTLERLLHYSKYLFFTSLEGLGIIIMHRDQWIHFSTLPKEKDYPTAAENINSKSLTRRRRFTVSRLLRVQSTISIRARHLTQSCSELYVVVQFMRLPFADVYTSVDAVLPQNIVGEWRYLISSSAGVQSPEKTTGSSLRMTRPFVINSF